MIAPCQYSCVFQFSIRHCCTILPAHQGCPLLLLSHRRYLMVDGMKERVLNLIKRLVVLHCNICSKYSTSSHTQFSYLFQSDSDYYGESPSKGSHYKTPRNSKTVQDPFKVMRMTSLPGTGSRSKPVPPVR